MAQEPQGAELESRQPPVDRVRPPPGPPAFHRPNRKVQDEDRCRRSTRPATPRHSSRRTARRGSFRAGRNRRTSLASVTRSSASDDLWRKTIRQWVNTSRADSKGFFSRLAPFAKAPILPNSRVKSETTRLVSLKSVTRSTSAAGFFGGHRHHGVGSTSRPLLAARQPPAHREERARIDCIRFACYCFMQGLYRQSTCSL